MSLIVSQDYFESEWFLFIFEDVFLIPQEGRLRLPSFVFHATAFPIEKPSTRNTG